MAARQPRPPEDSTYTSTTAIVINVLADVLGLARQLETDPSAKCQIASVAAFAIAARLRQALREEARR